MTKAVHILAIESSCDDTSAAVLEDNKVLSNLIATQSVHEEFGGVVPELASREHQKNIVPVVDQALAKAGIDKKELNAIAYTNGPGLLGSLLVGTSFAKAFSLALDIPLIEVHHMQAHILAHFIQNSSDDGSPKFPLLCLTVSGGHTQIVRVDSSKEFKIIGETRDDAAGEAFDKVAKILGLPYPGGPQIDKLAAKGDPMKYSFPEASIEGFDMSFSGLKTAVLYFVRDEMEKDSTFIEKEIENICASVQHVIVQTLIGKLERAAIQEGITELALAGGVSANSALRKSFEELCVEHSWNAHIPDFEYCTDNAAMIGIAGYFKFLNSEFGSLDNAPKARLSL